MAVNDGCRSSRRSRAWDLAAPRTCGVELKRGPALRSRRASALPEVASPVDAALYLAGARSETVRPPTVR